MLGPINEARCNENIKTPYHFKFLRESKSKGECRLFSARRNKCNLCLGRFDNGVSYGVEQESRERLLHLQGEARRLVPATPRLLLQSSSRAVGGSGSLESVRQVCIYVVRYVCMYVGRQVRLECKRRP